jgi:hypothetical protein
MGSSASDSDTQIRVLEGKSSTTLEAHVVGDGS